MDVLSTTGINPDAAKKISKGLANLLADYHVFYMNLRGYHWNVKGNQFFRLHSEFEELYDAVSDQIDEIAERMLQLGVAPTSFFSEYLKVATLKEESSLIEGKEMVKNVLGAYKHLLAAQREIIKEADSHGDIATVDLLSGYIDAQEKTVWMLTAWLG